jgi:type I restriction enzyme M protein
MKLVKKGDEDIEVEDGMKGRILPFELVQEEEFNYELRLIDEKVQRIEEIASEIEEIRDGFTEDESQEYLNEKENLDASKIKKDAKAKKDEIEPDTKEKLKKLVALWDEKSKLDKALKAERKALEERTIAHIQNLIDEEVKMLLDQKWIAPVMDKILANINNASFIIDKVKGLAQKYATSYNDLNDQLVESQNELAGLISDLTGDEFAIRGLNELKNSLK